jgi:hypothetical protein
VNRAATVRANSPISMARPLSLSPLVNPGEKAELKMTGNQENAKTDHATRNAA